MAVAVGDENDLRRIRRPGDAVVVARMVGQPASGWVGGEYGPQEDLAMHHEGDVAIVPGDSKLSDLAIKCNHSLGVGFVIRMDLDRHPARYRAALGGDDPEIGSAFVDNPFPIAAHPGESDAVRSVEWLAVGVGGDEDRSLRVERLSDDIGRSPEDFADVVESLAVGGPHGRVVLSIEEGELAMIAAAGVANPDVVIGGAAIALAIPGPWTADIGNLIAARRVHPFPGLARRDPPNPAALERDRVEIHVAG